MTTGLPADEAPQLVAAVTLMAGVLFILLAVFKMGWISRFLSKPVITGFLFGAAIEVVVGELPKLTGTDASGKNAWRKFADWTDSVDELHDTTLLVGVLALLTILVLRFVAPKVPGALVLVVGGLVVSVWFDLADRGVSTVGDVPRGMPTPEFPGIDVFTEHFATIVVAATAVLLIGFSQTAGDARLFASRHGYRIDVNQEAVAQGMSNVGAGLVQGMPVSTSLSASSLSDASGARTQMASVVTGVMVILTLFIFAPLFSDLPKPVLAAIIIDAVVFGMMDVPELRRMWRVHRADFWIAVAAIVGVLTAGVLAGVVIGIVLSLGWLVYVNSNPATPELGRRPGTTTFRPLDQFPDDETYPGIFIVRFDGGLYFVTTEVLSDRLRDHTVAAEPPVEHVVLDFEAVNFVDSQGAGELGRLVQIAGEREISVHFARMKQARAQPAGRRRHRRPARRGPLPRQRRRRRQRRTRGAAPAALTRSRSPSPCSHLWSRRAGSGPEVDVGVGRVPVDLRQLVVGQLGLEPVERADVVLELGDTARADDQRRHPRVAQRPAERELGQALAPFRGDVGEGTHPGESVLGEHACCPSPRRWRPVSRTGHRRGSDR